VHDRNGARKWVTPDTEMCESRRVQLEERMVVMADTVYRVTEVIGVSSESWEAAARSAVETAAKTVRDLRIAEVVRQDVAIENGAINTYRVRLAISFKYESSD
jgi:flavin-binding protein dodecin